MKKFLFIAAVINLFFFQGCSKNVVGPSNSNVYNIQIPVSVGSSWTYAVYDSIAQKADTVSVVINNKISTVSGKTTYLLLYQHITYTDTAYLISTGDTLEYLATLKSEPQPIFYFPLKAGGNYPEKYCSINVTKDSVTVPAGNFDNLYKIFESPHEGNFYGGTTYWVAPNIGIVKEKLQWIITVSNSRENVTWELLSYKIIGN